MWLTGSIHVAPNDLIGAIRGGGTPSRFLSRTFHFPLARTHQQFPKTLQAKNYITLKKQLVYGSQLDEHKIRASFHSFNELFELNLTVRKFAGFGACFWRVSWRSRRARLDWRGFEPCSCNGKPRPAPHANPLVCFPCPRLLVYKKLNDFCVCGLCEG